MGQKVNPVAVRLNFNRFSDSSWFSDYYYSKLLYQDLNFRQYLSSIKPPSASKLGFRKAKCIIHHFPKRSLIHLFCLSDPRKTNLVPTPQNIIKPSRVVATNKGVTSPLLPAMSSAKKLLEKQIQQIPIESRSMFSFKNVLIKTCWRDLCVRSYWLKSSTGHKKRALVNLHRGVVKTFSESFTFPRERCLVSCSAQKKLPHQIRHVDNYQAGIMFAAFPQSFAPSLIGSSKMPHFLSMWPELAKNFTGKSERASNTPEVFISGLSTKDSMWGLSPSKLFRPFFSSDLPRSFVAPIFAERGEDSNSRLGKQESILMKLYDSTLRWHYFNFYAMNFFFMDKMRDPNNRLPFRLNPYLLPLFPLFPQKKHQPRNDHISKVQGSEEVSCLKHSFFSTNISGSMDAVDALPNGAWGERRNMFGSSSDSRIMRSVDFYLSNVHSILSQNTSTFISLRPIKVHSVFQCASLIAQEVACKLEQKKSFRIICRLIFQQLAVCTYIKGIRVTCSGRLNGAEIAKTECRKFGETSLHVFSDKIDYAHAEASTPYGILGIKVWVSYI